MSEIIERLLRYAGKTMEDKRKPKNPNITAREACEIGTHIEQIQTGYSEIQHENEALKSSIYRLRETLKQFRPMGEDVEYYFEYNEGSEEIGDDVVSALAESPEQSTAHIKAQALDGYGDFLMSFVGEDRSPETNDYYTSAAEDARQAATQLRQEAKQ